MSWIKNTFEISHAKHKAIISMEGIRGFAVFLVFLVHYVTLIEPWILEESTTAQVAIYIRSIGNIGVDLFFVLSGYLIYGMLIKKHRPFVGYLMKRIKRIYPTFTIVFILYLALSALFPDASKIPTEWADGRPYEWTDSLLFIIQNYLLMPGLFDVTAIITVAWSLSYEFFYYLFIPLLIASLSMRTWTVQHRIIFFLLTSFFFFGYFAVNGGPIRLLMFISGILLYETIESKAIKNMPPIGLPALLIAIIAMVIFKELHFEGWWKYALLYVLFFIFCLECFLLSGFTTRLFSNTPLRWLGNMSYSYYLIHGLSLKFIFLLLEKAYPAQNMDTLTFWLFLPPIFFLTLIPSVILFVYIEKPYSLVRR